VEHMNEFIFEEDKYKIPGSTEKKLQSSEKKSWKILIVDDEEDVHHVTRMALRRLIFEERTVNFVSASSTKEAKNMLLLHSDLAVILLDVVMEEENAGLSLIHYIRKELGNTMVRIIIRTGHPGQAPEDNVTIDYDINDYREKTELTNQRLRTTVVTALRSFRDLSTIDILNQELEATQKELIFTLGEIAESRSAETGNHVKRVGEIAKILALEYGISEKDAEILRLAASMHDLGKLAIHDSILNKPGPLNSEEYRIMKTHSELGYNMLKGSKRPLLQIAAMIALEHHENFDQSGYPQGANSDGIHIYSQIVALADVFDALGNKRVYKEPWANDKIQEYLQEQRGKKFNPHLVDLLLANFHKISRVRERFPD
jgi:response regulator RpfG family c-di-GMP phosphodiesterase